MLLRLHTLPMHHLRSSTDFPERTVASGSSDDTIRLWEVSTGSPIRTFTGHTSAVLSISFSSDGQTLASGSVDNTIRLWEVSTGVLLRTLTGHTGNVVSVSFSPDGQTLASGGGYDNTIRLWEVSTGSPIRTFAGHTDWVSSVSFSPDGQTLASGGGYGDNAIRLWEVSTGVLLRTFTGHTGDDVLSVSFSPDGQTLASGSVDNTIGLWEVSTGTLLHTLTGHTDFVWSVSFSPDGQTLASGSEDGTVLLWDLAPAPPEPKKTVLESDEFDGSGQTLQSFWQVRNGDKSDWELNNGQLTIDAGFNLGLWSNDTSTRFYQVTDETHFEIESSFIVEYADACTVTGIVIYSPIGEWVTLKLWGVNNEEARIQFQGRETELTPNVIFQPREGRIPIQMRLKRAGDRYEAWYKQDAQGDWISAGTATVALQGPVEVGIYAGICAAEGPGRLTATFDYFRITASTENTELSTADGDANGDGVVDVQDLVFVAGQYRQSGQNAADVNGDGTVDIEDLIFVAGVLDTEAAAPSALVQASELFTAADVQAWLTQAQGLHLTDARSQRGIRFLQQLLLALTPQKTSLLPNYPNPFNPETWIPYHLANDSNVSLSIYDINGALVRELDLGHQRAGYYTDRSRAAYWDGRNESGEAVASGVYFYTLSAGDYSATRKMVILK